MRQPEGKVYFIGAGPGDPELLTLKGKRIIEGADVVIYADSLVNPEICRFAREGAEVHGSSSLTLEEITQLIVDATRRGKTVARVHTGDPSIFGALWEQMDMLNQHGIAYEVVPGVSSIFAAAAALPAELTVPGLSQTVIITRLEGRTPVPALEGLPGLAAHNATMALFLSVGMIENVIGQLLQGGYSGSTPAAVVHRASWQDQKIARGTLADMVAKVADAGIASQALILVGEALSPDLKASSDILRSRLYNKRFSHKHRRSRDGGE